MSAMDMEFKLILYFNFYLVTTENGGLGSPETEDDKGPDEPLREQVIFIQCLFISYSLYVNSQFKNSIFHRLP